MGRVSRRDAGLVFILCALGGTACTTVSAPVLRHQTGETLGQKRFRIFGHYESSRIFQPISTPETVSVPQTNSIFQGSFVGVQAEGGVLPNLDLQLGTYFTSGGGGWRLGGKYQAYRSGRIAASAMLGYSAASGTGTVTYMTAAQPIEVSQTLSAYTVDLSVPVSFRINPMFAFYGGPMLLRSGVSGSFGGNVVSDTSNDLGANLGLQVTSGMFVGDLELAELKVHDPFADASRFVPYLGMSFGVVF
jgi:hypothetical protein